MASRDQPQQTNHLCVQGSQERSLMAPGMYRSRPVQRSPMAALKLSICTRCNNLEVCKKVENT